MSHDSEDKMITIECAPNGPLIVNNLPSLRNSRGESLPLRPTFGLCRCGKSANKPFCDGTHATVGFSDTNRSDGSLNKRDNYVGKTITIHDNRGLCAHVSYCADELEAVFNADQEPWIHPNAATSEMVIKTINKCPSGALSYSVKGVEHREQDCPPEIVVSKDGPYFIRGGIELKNQSRGEGASEEHYTLCRCGGSKNLPFCDGTHRTIQFKDENN